MTEAQRAQLKEIEHKWISGVYGAASSYMAAMSALEAAYAAGAADASQKLVQPLKDACDREWSNETPEQIVSIAANAIYWRSNDPALPSFLNHLYVLLPDVAQLLDGWHQDGTAWSDWDEGVREQVSLIQKSLEAIRARQEQGKVKP